MASGSAESATLSLKDTDNNNDTLLGDKNTNSPQTTTTTPPVDTSNSASLAPKCGKSVNGNSNTSSTPSKSKSSKSKGKNTANGNQTATAAANDTNASEEKLSKKSQVKENKTQTSPSKQVESNGVSTTPSKVEEAKVNGNTNQIVDQIAKEASSIEVESSNIGSNGNHLSTLKDIQLTVKEDADFTSSLKQSIDLVRYSDPIREDIIIDTNQLQERYQFFEQYSEAQATAAKAKRVQITPPREIIRRRKESGPEIVESEPANLDPSVVRSSDVVDDRPRTDTAKKMLNVFKQLEAAAANGSSNGSSNGRQVISPVGGGSGIPPKPLKRITPPRELDTPNRAVLTDANGAERQLSSDDHEDANNVVSSSNGTSGPSSIDGIVSGSTAAVISAFTNAASGATNASSSSGASSRPVIPEDLTNVLPPEMTRSLAAKFENWNGNSSASGNNNNNNNYPASASLKNGINNLLTNRINGYLNGISSDATIDAVEGNPGDSVDATSPSGDNKSQVDSELGQTGVKKCDTVKNLKAKFEQIKDEPSKSNSERRIRRVSSFVVSTCLLMHNSLAFFIRFSSSSSSSSLRALPSHLVLNLHFIILARVIYSLLSSPLLYATHLITCIFPLIK